MTSQILPTKLYTPTHYPNIVLRPRLLDQLAGWETRVLTLVSAPPGYGKSTLLIDWVTQSTLPVAWFSLDSGDNDPARFWAHFVAALRNLPQLADSNVGETLLNQLQLSPPPINEALLGGFVTEIASQSKPFVIILDDLHLVSTTAVLDGLLFILENLADGKSGMHLVVSTRVDPPWPLARLRVQRQVVEIRAGDLRFNIDETAQFINDTSRLNLSTQEIIELDQRTEGWVAGLQMAAISMEGAEDISDFLVGFTGTHRFVLDYLMEEVLNQQSPEVSKFLLQTSILERLSGQLCAAVTGVETSKEILLQLEKANMFLVTLDDQRMWYRYHHLFADLLSKWLMMKDPEIIPKLHRRASIWYSQAGYAHDAVSHAVQTRNWEFAAGQIEGYVLTMIQNGEMILTRQWMHSLPEDIIRPRPILCLAQAWTSTKFATVETAEELLAEAEKALTKDSDHRGSLDPNTVQLVNSQITVLKVVIARARGDSTQRQQELALKALDQVSHADDAAARATLLFRLGLCYLDLGKSKQADSIFCQAVELSRISGNHYAMHAASYGRMVVARLHGDLQELAAICRENLTRVSHGEEEQRPLVGIDQTIYGALCYEWNDLDEAESNLNQGLSLIEGVGITELLIKGQFAYACLRAVRGELSDVPDLVKIAKQSHPSLKTYAAALDAHIRLLLIRLGSDTRIDLKLNQWAGDQALILRGQSTYDWDVQEILVYARVLCWQVQHQHTEYEIEKLRQAHDFLVEQRHTLQDLGWYGILLELDVVLALILQVLGREGEALSILTRALELAEPHGFVRIFVDEGEPIKDLLNRLYTSNVSSMYVCKLLDAFEGWKQSTPSVMKGTDIGWTKALSDRELQVLRLLNTHLSVPEIADEIHLAPTTVRTHVRNIYRKLGVHNRIEALQKGRKLGLL